MLLVLVLVLVLVQWLMYWVVFAAFSFIENFSTVLLYYVPWYYKIKTASLLLLQLPG